MTDVENQDGDLGCLIVPEQPSKENMLRLGGKKVSIVYQSVIYQREVLSFIFIVFIVVSYILLFNKLGN